MGRKSGRGGKQRHVNSVGACNCAKMGRPRAKGMALPKLSRKERVSADVQRMLARKAGRQVY